MRAAAAFDEDDEGEEEFAVLVVGKTTKLGDVVVGGGVELTVLVVRLVVANNIGVESTEL